MQIRADVRRWMIVAAALTLWAFAGGNAIGQSGAVRVFAVQPKIDLADSATYQTYHDHLVGLVNLQVVPNLAGDKTNVIVFPEDVGLPAAFIGERGALARAQSTTVDAFTALGYTYSQPPLPDFSPIVYYAAFLGVTDPNRLVTLALTDTLWRAFTWTMHDIATQTGAWVIASTNVSGSIVSAADPFSIGVLTNPYASKDKDPYLGDPTVTVFVAADPNVYNTAFVFSPAGEVVAARRKAYLVPDEENLLGFAYGQLAGVTPIDLGFAQAGIITSKDAWMPDVLDRLEILGTNVLVQPEGFLWTIPDDFTPIHQQDWLPDNFIESGWSAVQKYSGMRYDAIPHLTGNLFDRPFDGQSAIIADAIPGLTSWAYVGQDQQGGFLATAPWVIPDPGIADPSLSLADRRAALRQVGFALLPGYPMDNQYFQTVVYSDIYPSAPFSVEATGKPGALGKSLALAPADQGEQTHACIAADGAGQVLAAWADSRDGIPQIYIARSNGGAAFTEARRIAPSANPQRTPAVLFAGNLVYAAWQEETAGERRIVVARSGDGGRTFGRPSALPTASPADEWLPSLTWGAGRGLSGASVYLAFVQTVGTGDQVNERIMVAHAALGSADWQITPADPNPAPYSAPNPRNNQWSPSITVRNGEVAVAWVGFQDFSWDVYLSRSLDGGSTFSAPVRVDDAPDAWERVHSDPMLVADPNGRLLCAWSDLRQRQPNAQARAALVGGAPSASAILASTAPSDARSWRPRLALLHGNTVAAVWQDDRSLGNDIYMALSPDGGKTFRKEKRIDDGGDGPSYQFAPQIAVVRPNEVLVAWEDTRSGRRQIRYVLGHVTP